MNQGNQEFSKKFIARSLVLLLFIAPLVSLVAAYTLSRVQTTLTLQPEERSTSQLLNAVKNQLNEFSTAGEYNDLSVESVKRYNAMWYLLTLKGRNESGNTNTTRAIVGDFRNDPSKLTLVTPPGGYLQYPDISDGMGMPYELIDDFNKAEGNS